MENLKEIINFDTKTLSYSAPKEAVDDVSSPDNEKKLVTYTDRKFNCSYCGRRFFSNQSLTVHLMLHSDDERKVNTERPDSSSSSSSWKHKFANDKGIACTNLDCNFVALDAVEFNKHLLTCEGVRLDASNSESFCIDCDAYFTSNDHLKAHKVLRHEHAVPVLSLRVLNSTKTTIDTDPRLMSVTKDDSEKISQYSDLLKKRIKNMETIDSLAIREHEVIDSNPQLESNNENILENVGAANSEFNNSVQNALENVPSGFGDDTSGCRKISDTPDSEKLKGDETVEPVADFSSVKDKNEAINVGLCFADDIQKIVDDFKLNDAEEETGDLQQNVVTVNDSIEMILPSERSGQNEILESAIDQTTGIICSVQNEDMHAAKSEEAAQEEEVIDKEIFKNITVTIEQIEKFIDARKNNMAGEKAVDNTTNQIDPQSSSKTENLRSSQSNVDENMDINNTPNRNHDCNIDETKSQNGAVESKFCETVIQKERSTGNIDEVNSFENESRTNNLESDSSEIVMNQVNEDHSNAFGSPHILSETPVHNVSFELNIENRNNVDGVTSSQTATGENNFSKVVANAGTESNQDAIKSSGTRNDIEKSTTENSKTDWINDLQRGDDIERDSSLPIKCKRMVLGNGDNQTHSEEANADEKEDGSFNKKASLSSETLILYQDVEVDKITLDTVSEPLEEDDVKFSYEPKPDKENFAISYSKPVRSPVFDWVINDNNLLVESPVEAKNKLGRRSKSAVPLVIEYKSDDSADHKNKSNSNTPKSQDSAKRKVGRPKKSVMQSVTEHNSNDNTAREYGMEMDTPKLIVPAKNKVGRPRKSVANLVTEVKSDDKTDPGVEKETETPTLHSEKNNVGRPRKSVTNLVVEHRPSDKTEPEVAKPLHSEKKKAGRPRKSVVQPIVEQELNIQTNSEAKKADTPKSEDSANKEVNRGSSKSSLYNHSTSENKITVGTPKSKDSQEILKRKPGRPRISLQKEDDVFRGFPPQPSRPLMKLNMLTTPLLHMADPTAEVSSTSPMSVLTVNISRIEALDESVRTTPQAISEKRSRKPKGFYEKLSSLDIESLGEISPLPATSKRGRKPKRPEAERDAALPHVTHANNLATNNPNMSSRLELTDGKYYREIGACGASSSNCYDADSDDGSGLMIDDEIKVVKKYVNDTEKAAVKVSEQLIRMKNRIAAGIKKRDETLKVKSEHALSRKRKLDEVSSNENVKSADRLNDSCEPVVKKKRGRKNRESGIRSLSHVGCENSVVNVPIQEINKVPSKIISMNAFVTTSETPSASTNNNIHIGEKITTNLEKAPKIIFEYLKEMKGPNIAEPLHTFYSKASSISMQDIDNAKSETAKAFNAECNKNSEIYEISSDDENANIEKEVQKQEIVKLDNLEQDADTKGNEQNVENFKTEKNTEQRNVVELDSGIGSLGHQLAPKKRGPKPKNNFQDGVLVDSQQKKRRGRPSKNFKVDINAEVGALGAADKDENHINENVKDYDISANKSLNGIKLINSLDTSEVSNASTSNICIHTSENLPEQRSRKSSSNLENSVESMNFTNSLQTFYSKVSSFVKVPDFDQTKEDDNDYTKTVVESNENGSGLLDSQLVTKKRGRKPKMKLVDGQLKKKRGRPVKNNRVDINAEDNTDGVADTNKNDADDKSIQDFDVSTISSMHTSEQIKKDGERKPNTDRENLEMNDLDIADSLHIFYSKASDIVRPQNLDNEQGETEDCANEYDIAENVEREGEENTESNQNEVEVDSGIRSFDSLSSKRKRRRKPKNLMQDSETVLDGQPKKKRGRPPKIFGATNNSEDNAVRDVDMNDFDTIEESIEDISAYESHNETETNSFDVPEISNASINEMLGSIPENPENLTGLLRNSVASNVVGVRIVDDEKMETEVNNERYENARTVEKGQVDDENGDEANTERDENAENNRGEAEENSGIGSFDSQLVKRKRGRRPKKNGSPDGQSKKKRGRPPKTFSTDMNAEGYTDVAIEKNEINEYLPDGTKNINKDIYRKDRSNYTYLCKMLRKPTIQNSDWNAMQFLVTCGRCGEQMTRWHYLNFHQMNHYFLCWIEGEDKIDLKNYSLVEQILRNGLLTEAIAKRRVKLYCESCFSISKSVIGHASHISSCEQDSYKSLTKCELCDKHIKPCSLKSHYQTMHNISTVPNCDELNRRELSNRKKSEETKKVKAYEKTVLYKNQLLNDDEFWEKLDTAHGLFMCMGTKCKQMSVSKEELKLHLQQCDGSLFEFKCAECDYMTKYENEIIYHSKTGCEKVLTVPVRESKRVLKKRKFLIDEDDEDLDSCNIISNLGQKNKDEDFVNSEPSTSSAVEDNDIPENTHKDRMKLKGKPALNKKLRTRFLEMCLRMPNSLVRNLNIRTKTLSRTCLVLNCTVKNEEFLIAETNRRSMYLPSSWTSMGISFDNRTVMRTFNLFQSDVVKGVPICYVGGPVTSLAWAPLPALHREQYLAVATLKDMDESIHLKKPVTDKASNIQIWKFPFLDNISNEIYRPRLAFIIGHQFGPVLSMEWCPSGGFDNSVDPVRIGILAAATCTSCIAIYCINKMECQPEKNIVERKPDLILRLRGEDNIPCTKIVWKRNYPHTTVIGGFANGKVAIWDITTKSFLRKDFIIYPHTIFRPHITAICGLDVHWIQNGRFLVTSSLNECFSKVWDLHDLIAPLQKVDTSLTHQNCDWSQLWTATVHSNTKTNRSGMIATGHSVTSVGLRSSALLLRTTLAYFSSETHLSRKITQSSTKHSSTDLTVSEDFSGKRLDPVWSLSYSSWNDMTVVSLNSGLLSAFITKQVAPAAAKDMDEKIISSVTVLPLGKNDKEEDGVQDEKPLSSSVDEIKFSKVARKYALFFQEKPQRDVKPVKSSLLDLEKHQILSINKVRINLSLKDKQ